MSPAMGSDRFTIFIVLPWDEVCSVRNLSSGVTLKSLYCRLELLSGCPAYTYRMVSSDGRVLEDDQPLKLSVNVWDGFMVRMQILEKWRLVYEGVTRGNLDWFLCNEPGRELNDGQTETVDSSGQEDGQHDVEFGGVALYLSCWFGNSMLSRLLLDAGVDPNSISPFGRSAMFACVVKDHYKTLITLLEYGAKTNIQDLLGETVLDLAKKNLARQCINQIRSFHADRIQPSYDTGEVESSKYKKSTNSKNEPKWCHQTKSKSARISANSNVKLLSQTNGTDKDVDFKATKFPGKDVFDMGLIRSVTYNDGFHSNNVRPIYISTPWPSGGPRFSSPTSLTPRSLRNLSDTESRTNTPRSPLGLNTLRVAVPHSKLSSKTTSKNSQHTVTWDEQIVHSDFSPIQTGELKETQTTFSSPSNATSTGLGDSDDKSSHMIGQSSQLRPTSRSTSLEENESPEDKDDDAINKEDDISNANVTQKEVDDTAGTRSPNGSVASERSKAKKPWSFRRQLVTRNKHHESLETAKRRIQLSEQQKRNTKKRESFEQWLKKKRRQELEEESSDDSDESSDDEERKKTNMEAFNNWIKEIEHRNIKQVNPNSAISLHKRKTRAIKGLIGIKNISLEEKENKDGPEDTSSYMHSYQTWLNNRSDKKGNKNRDDKSLNERKARKGLEAMRNDVLAEAVSFEEWMDHAEERKRLTKIISKSKNSHSEEADDPKRCQSAISRNISFEKWKQELEAKEAKRKIAQLRKRRQQEYDQQLRENSRSSSAVPHEMWVQKRIQIEQQEKLQKQQQQQQQLHQKYEKRDSSKGNENSTAGDIGTRNETGGFESWVNKKHEVEIQKIDSSIRHEQQLLEELRQKKKSSTTL